MRANAAMLLSVMEITRTMSAIIVRADRRAGEESPCHRERAGGLGESYENCVLWECFHDVSVAGVK